jgi:hypothetical protein
MTMETRPLKGGAWPWRPWPLHGTGCVRVNAALRPCLGSRIVCGPTGGVQAQQLQARARRAAAIPTHLKPS